MNGRIAAEPGPGVELPLPALALIGLVMHAARRWGG